jgi:hypothetical protein
MHHDMRYKHEGAISEWRDVMSHITLLFSAVHSLVCLHCFIITIPTFHSDIVIADMPAERRLKQGARTNTGKKPASSQSSNVIVISSDEEDSGQAGPHEQKNPGERTGLLSNTLLPSSHLVDGRKARSAEEEAQWRELQQCKQQLKDAQEVRERILSTIILNTLLFIFQ